MSGIPNAIALVWDEPDAGGHDASGLVAAVGTGDGTQRYDAWDLEAMDEFGGGPPGWLYGLAWRISSASLFAPVTGATVLIFYSDGWRFPFSTPVRFSGFFLLLDNRSGGRWDVNLADRPLLNDGQEISLPNWENAPTSMIVVHTAQGPERRLSAAATLTPIWNNIIDEQLAAASGGVATVTRSGDPSWDWLPFPKFLNQNRNYLRVHQDLHVALEDPLPNYAASLTYYLRLRALNGTVTGRVVRWEYWTEGGLFGEFVEALVRPYVILGAERVNDFLAGGGAMPPGPPVTRLYYLPGVQTEATEPGETHIFQGSTDDATIVLQTEETP
jgi:hypothetical protein